VVVVVVVGDADACLLEEDVGGVEFSRDMVLGGGDAWELDLVVAGNISLVGTSDDLEGILGGAAIWFSIGICGCGGRRYGAKSDCGVGRGSWISVCPVVCVVVGLCLVLDDYTCCFRYRLPFSRRPFVCCHCSGDGGGVN